MKRANSIRLGVLLAGISAFVIFFFPALPAASQSTGPGKLVPKLEPIAETKLLMEGLAHANFRGLERHLSARPTEEETWVFARGQALLIAEAANLLMLRPPKKEGQETWFLRSMELRRKAAALAQTIATKNLEQSRKGLIDLGTTCTKCHQNFKVPVLIEPFAEAPPMKAE
jgi:hypothetical protein